MRPELNILDRSAARPVLVAAMVLALCGCRTSHQFHCDKYCQPENDPVGRVNVSGPLAVARAIPVDVDGVAISDIVEMAIRPGYRALGEVALAGQGHIGSAGTAVTNSPAGVEDAFRAWAEDSRAEDPDDEAGLRTEFVGRLAGHLRESGRQSGIGDEITETLNQQLTLLKSRGDRLPPLRDDNQVPTDAQISELRSVITEVLGDWDETRAAPALAMPTRLAASGLSAVSVIVSQRAGRRLVIPLRTVTLTPAGDIRVLPGEHVTIAWTQQLAEAATANSTAANGTADVVVNALTFAPEVRKLTAAGSPAGLTLASLFREVSNDMEVENSVMVSRVASDGVAEIHLLSTPLDAQLGSSGEALAQLRGFQVADQDVVSFGVLELNPLVVQGRTISRLSRTLDSDTCLLHPAGPAPPVAPALQNSASRWHAHLSQQRDRTRAMLAR